MADDQTSLEAADSLRLYRAYVDASTSGIFVYDSRRRLLDVNPAACRMHGRGRGEMLALAPCEFIAPESLHVFQAFLKAVSKGETFRGEARGLRRDGSRFDAEIEGHLITIAGRCYFLCCLIDVTDRQRFEEELRHRGEHQALVAEFSSRLLEAEPRTMDEAIEAALARIGETYEVDFCGFYWFEDQRRWVRAHLWIRDGFARHAQWQEVAVEDAPWASARIMSGEVVRLETLDDYPPEALQERARLQELGIVSDLMLPVLVDGTLVGSFTAGTFRRSRTWAVPVVAELQTLGEILAAGYGRSLAGAALHQREAELTRSQKIARVGSYVFLPREGVYSSSPELEAIQGLAPDAEQTLESWMRRIHPDDRERMLEAVRCSVGPGSRESEYMSEYRVIRNDGTVRVLEDRGEIERDEHGEVKRIFGTVLDITDRRDTEQELSRALDELRALKERLEVENVYLREEVRLAHGSDHIIGESSSLEQCLRLVARVAPTEATVLIVGETGTGKELIARALHDQSRREGPLVGVNCAALPPNLIESELFGYERGAFTGAQSRKPGRLELARGGTLFLDEIGELSLEVQAKLLRSCKRGYTSASAE